MIHLCAHEDCTGCMACGNACRHGAISFRPDEEGFLHPEINSQECVECGLCARVCPILTPCPKPENEIEKRVFAAWTRDEKIRRESSSGGLFSALAQNTLAAEGVVFGAAFDENFSLRHISVEDETDLHKLRGSKYVQSEIGDAFLSAEKFLKAGRVVLFTGTPCQIAGLRMFLRKPYVNLLTVDILCHGVPSPLVFKSYREWLEIKLGNPLSEFKFRDKEWSWKSFNTKASPLDQTKIPPSPFIAKGKSLFGTWQEDPWMRGFLREYFLRPGCHACRFANTERPSDITLADYWGYRSRKGIFKDDDKGISMVMVNSEKGLKAFEAIREKLIFTETPVEEAVRGNPTLSRSFKPSPLRDEFWKDFRKKGYAGTLEKYMYPEKVGFMLRTLYKVGRDSLLYSALSFAYSALSFAARVSPRFIRRALKKLR